MAARSLAGLTEVVVANAACIRETYALWIAPHPFDYVINSRHGGIVSLLVSVSSANEEPSAWSGWGVDSRPFPVRWAAPGPASPVNGQGRRPGHGLRRQACRDAPLAEELHSGEWGGRRGQ
jgi:hypothetical protein